MIGSAHTHIDHVWHLLLNGIGEYSLASLQLRWA